MLFTHTHTHTHTHTYTCTRGRLPHSHTISLRVSASSPTTKHVVHSARNKTSMSPATTADCVLPRAPQVERMPGTTYERKKMRIPSYCDRILWRSMPHLRDNVRQLALASAPGVSTSDHKPLYAQFEIDPTPLVSVRWHLRDCPSRLCAFVLRL